jgi:hypothetical protein
MDRPALQPLLRRLGALAHILRNRVYLGAINHKAQSHPGEHERIVERALFEAVQAKLTDKRRGKRRSRRSSEALLLGRIFDDRGHRMTPSYAVKNGARYRYYVSCVLAQGRKHEAGSVPRVPAPEIEAIVLRALREADESAEKDLSERELVHERLARVVVREGSRSRLPFRTMPSRSGSICPGRPPQPAASARSSVERRPMRAEARARLLEAIAKARRWLDGLISGRFASTAEIALHERCSERAVRITLGLAFLAPTIVRAAVEGRLPYGLNTSSFSKLPILSGEQLQIAS